MNAEEDEDKSSFDAGADADGASGYCSQVCKN